ncbi:hypothetical protein [Flexithrix dorotheae]|uniref:hypothetical protein n=1 Tax=Flexithrix dorotheae TaxID=70993 RepID=UPI00036E01A8|nr:hypothetical protein [Flexithrix dorotheae]
MGLRDFSFLSTEEKLKLISERGSYMGAISYHRFKLKLFKLENEFYEIWYSPRDKKTEDVKPASRKRIHLYPQGEA